MKKKYKFLIILLALLAGAAVVGWNFEPVQAAARKIVYNLRFNDGLVTYWSFDGATVSGTVVTDRSGSGNTANLQSGPSTTEGVVGQAISFDGSNDYISSTNGFSNPQNFSVSFWFKTSVASGHKIIGTESDATGTGSSSYDRQFYIGTDGKLYFGWYSGSFNTIVSTDTLNDDKWHYVTGTHASGGGGVLYVDGVSQGTAANDAESYVGYWRLGSYKLTSWTNASDGYFTGQVDEVRIYNRSLSAAEQAYIYNRTKPAGSGSVAKSVTNMNGLVGDWDFDDCDACTTVADRSGRGNNGTMYDATGSPDPVNLHTTGKLGNGATFDGTKYYVDAGNNSTLNITGAITISAWIKANTIARSAVVAKDFTDVRGYMFGMDTAGEVYLEKDGSIFLNSGATMSAGRWNHIALTFDGADWATWLNGAKQGLVSDPVGIPSQTTTSLTIGRRNYTGVESYFDGSIDEVKIYNRGLSEAEIKNLYNSTRKILVNVPQKDLVKDGLVGNWSFNGPDMSGVTVIDRGSGGNNGTLTGGVATTEGIIGQGLHLDGTNDYVTMADHASLDLTGSITMSTWLRHSSDTFKAWEAIFTKGDSAYRLHLCGNTDFCGGPVALLNAIEAAFSGTSCSGNGVTSTVVPVTNRWYFVTVVYDGSTIKMYVDGALDAQVSCTGTVTANGFAVNIGENSDQTGRYWNGDIDDVRLYNRALSADEVLKLYKAGAQ